MTFALSLSPKVLESLEELRGASEERIAEVARSASPPSANTVAVHIVEVTGGDTVVRARSFTPPNESWGLGGGIVSTASPAAAAVRLLARGSIAARGALPPERCIDPDEMFAELEARGVRFDVTNTPGRANRCPDEQGIAMRVGVPTEIKQDEYRVALTPAGARELGEHGHEVLIQAGAGEGSAIPDDAYASQGAQILPDAESVFEQAEMILGVKEPQPEEVELLRPEHTLFTYLHLAPAPELTRALQESGATCVAYETVEDAQGRLPLLAPMSEVAGKIATQAGAFFLEKPLGGRGILLGGVPGVAAATVMIIGGGAVGMHAAFVAIGMEADVFVYDVSIDKLRELDVAFGGRASTVFSSTLAIEEMLPQADLVIGAVLVHGAKAPYVVRREQLKLMKTHAVLVDVAIDQGGCFETSHPTTHRDPDLRGRRDHALLRRQHAGRGADHLDLCPDQCDAPLCPGARGPRRRGGGPPRPGPEAGDQRRRRYRHASSRGRSRRRRAHPRGGRARPKTESLTKEEKWQPQPRRSRRRRRPRSLSFRT